MKYRATSVLPELSVPEIPTNILEYNGNVFVVVYVGGGFTVVFKVVFKVVSTVLLKVVFVVVFNFY